ncbi:MAG: carbamoyl-phosphate synthase large subunit [Lentisphaerae bacterium]|nr:carbamoyl-phosphate synthase large subunit [Lentisphaerota bacterium]
MPKRDDIKKVMIIGSGPIIIGQACEFDYSGTQACKALRNLGYQIVLVNSNPATIMTDPETADVTYIEPLNLARMTEIIEKERPDALLPNLGGQSALNLASELSEAGVLDKYNVEVIGVQIDAIKRGEDRNAFKETMHRLGIDMARSQVVNSLEDAEAAAKQIGFPVVVRPAYTMGGTGGGFCYNIEELRTIAARGLQASIVHQILIEESLLGWEELELEVVRDAKGQMITVCFIENVDPVGVHTGDSFCVAPMLTISQELQARMQKYAYSIVEGIGVIGGTNVQFAYNPKDDRVVVIEINPRTSRSSALASKATGFPIAYISAILATGVTLDELPYWRDGSLEKYTPCGDYVVVKFARWAFEKFRNVEDKLGTQMRAVGEVMSIGKTYKEAFMKAIRSLENGNPGLGFVKGYQNLSLPELLERLNIPTSQRQFLLYEALRKGADIDELYKKTAIKPWYLEQMLELVELEKKILEYQEHVLPDELLIQAKKDGFSDLYLAQLLKTPEALNRKQRLDLGLTGAWDRVPVSGVADASYYYSSYNIPDQSQASDNARNVMVLGGGPIRIGQGIEFDYCCVHAAKALREMGYETIMVNCNPETVSTDYDTSDKLYFEPLTLEDVLNIYQKENPLGVIVQFGGQTPLNLATALERNGVKILGTSPSTIDMAEDRDLFRKLMERLEIPMPESGMASNLEQALLVTHQIGFPVMVRPSFVLGGRGMEIVRDEEMLRQYVAAAVDVTPERPILIDRFLENAIETEADAIADGTDAFVPSIMEHIEQAGIHSGDSACVIPPKTIPEKHIETIKNYTRKIAKEMQVVGLMNMQYAICNDVVYVLEANPRASRTVPLVSKVCGISMAKIATRIMLGEKLSQMDLREVHIPHFGVKEAVFPFPMLPEVDPVLGPEMRSTGEVLGMASTPGLAFFKAEEAAKPPLPEEGTVLITVNPQDRAGILEPARKFQELGFKIIATEGTGHFLQEHGISSELVAKINEGRPDIVDMIKNGYVQLVINTPIGKASAKDDSYIRKNAIRFGVPYITTVAAALATANGVAARRQGHDTLKSLQEYHAGIKACNDRNS